MKPFFGISLDKDPKNEIMNGEEFVSSRLSEEKSKKLHEAEAEAEHFFNKAKLPLPIRVISYVFAALAALILVCLAIVISEFGETEAISIIEALKRAYNNAPHFLWAAAAFLLFFISVTVFSLIRKRKILSSEAARGAVIRLNMATEEALSEMAVIENAPRVDVLSFRYKTKEDGKIVPKLTFRAVSPYVAIELFAFAENGILTLADTEERFDIPLAEIEGIERINKNILIANRGMEIIEEYSNKLTDFKMSTNDSGDLFVKPYYVMTVNRLGEKHGIYFPCYSLPLFEELTGIHPGKDNTDTDAEDAPEDDFTADFDIE